ncbi:MAG: threonine synthase, partial [Methyloligellaceae bacterium]
VSLGAPDRQVRFSVPTGNFGDVFAGFMARQMGLPIAKLVIATNINDILKRTLDSGFYEPQTVVATRSPSMDIQISSNFERLLFELGGRDGERVRSLMEDLRDQHRFGLSENERDQLSAVFSAHRLDEAETVDVIRELHRRTGYVADPHTAVGVGAAWKMPQDPARPIIALATAHPTKFPETVKDALGQAPEQPEFLSRKLSVDERYTVLSNDYASVAHFIGERSRAVREQSL